MITRFGEEATLEAWQRKCFGQFRTSQHGANSNIPQSTLHTLVMVRARQQHSLD